MARRRKNSSHNYASEHVYVSSEHPVCHCFIDTPHGWILAALDDVERLQDDNKYVCETCSHLVEAERSMHYVTLPQILTLHLKRFAATSRYVYTCVRLLLSDS